MPGIVIAMKRPQWEMTLVDSLQKRCGFLSNIANEMGLVNVNICWSRAEDLGRESSHREGYHLAMARAVADMRVLVELCVPLLEVGGVLIAAKGPKPEEEIEKAGAALKALNAEVVNVEGVASYGAHGQRTVVTVRKIDNTPDKYPRRAGMPNKRPL